MEDSHVDFCTRRNLLLIDAATRAINARCKVRGTGDTHVTLTYLSSRKLIALPCKLDTLPCAVATKSCYSTLYSRLEGSPDPRLNLVRLANPGNGVITKSNSFDLACLAEIDRFGPALDGGIIRVLENPLE